jgi:hypothetical protein
VGILLFVLAILSAPAVGLAGPAASSLSGSALGSSKLLPPVIAAAPGTMGYGGVARITTSDAGDVTEVLLVPTSPGLLQGGLSQLVLLIGQRGSGWISASEPDSHATAAPGSYLLFIQKPGLLTPLVSLPWPVVLQGSAPPASSSPPAPAEGAATAGPGTSHSSTNSGHKGSEATTTTEVGRKSSTAARTASKPTAWRGGAETLKAKKAGSRSPLAGLPLAPLVVVAFALVAWRLLRISEPVESRER